MCSAVLRDTSWLSCWTWCILLSPVLFWPPHGTQFCCITHPAQSHQTLPHNPSAPFQPKLSYHSTVIHVPNPTPSGTAGLSLLFVHKQMLSWLSPRQGQPPVHGSGCDWRGLAAFLGCIVFLVSNVTLSRGKYFTEIACCGVYF